MLPGAVGLACLAPGAWQPPGWRTLASCCPQAGLGEAVVGQSALGLGCASGPSQPGCCCGDSEACAAGDTCCCAPAGSARPLRAWKFPARGWTAPGGDWPCVAGSAGCALPAWAPCGHACPAAGSRSCAAATGSGTGEHASAAGLGWDRPSALRWADAGSCMPDTRMRGVAEAARAPAGTRHVLGSFVCSCWSCRHTCRWNSGACSASCA